MAVQSTEAKRATRIVRSFMNESGGDPTPRVKADTVAIIFKTAANDKSTTVKLSDFGTLPSPGMLRAAAAFGLSTNIGNAGLQVGEEHLDDPDALMEAISLRVKELQAGEWTSPNRGGGRPSLVWEAFIAFRQAGKAPTDDAAMAKFKDKMDDPDWIKSLHANERFEAIFNKIKASKSKVAPASEKDLLA